jgi:hypothetical protein
MKKTIIFLAAWLLMFALFAFAESYRKTTADMYRSSAAEIRADQYRSMYEVCDEHHNCTNVNGGKPQPAESAFGKDQMETVKPVMNVPVWA